MVISVIGMGKIGLPLSVQFAKMGHKVFGVDINPETVSLINQAKEPFPGEAHLAEYLLDLVPRGALKATTSFEEAITISDVVVLVVPLFVDSDAQPDFRAMDAATKSVGKYLKPNALVCFETTLPVGTTRNRLLPILEKESGLKEGDNLFVVFSPERVLTGRVFDDLKKYPKLIGGISSISAQKGKLFYESVLEFDDRPDLQRPNGVWDLGSAEASELAKLAETTYRDVNIGLANQFALFAEKYDINVYSVIEASNSQPFSHIHQPGIAVGGHCIPVYPRLYLWNDPDASIVRTARKVNAEMPSQVVTRLVKTIGTIASKKICVLGAAYRGGVKETAFSGIWDLTAELEKSGADVYVNDPLYSDEELEKMGLKSFKKGDTAEIVVLQANHSDYLAWTSHDVKGVKVVSDGRNFLNQKNWQNVQFIELGIGK